MVRLRKQVTDANAKTQEMGRVVTYLEKEIETKVKENKVLEAKAAQVSCCCCQLLLEPRPAKRSVIVRIMMITITIIIAVINMIC